MGLIIKSELIFCNFPMEEVGLLRLASIRLAFGLGWNCMGTL